MIKELWATPILQVQLENYEDITKELMRVQQSVTEPESKSINVGKYFFPSDILFGFTETILKTANDFLSHYNGGTVEIKRSWFHHQGFGDKFHPHVHYNTRLASVYYMNAPDYCGDILLFDPRNGARGWDANDLVYHRITPQQGMLLMFPAYLVHATEENRNREKRVSFVSNLGDV